MVTATTVSDEAGMEYWQTFCDGFLTSSTILKPRPVDHPRRLHINFHSDAHLETVRIIQPRKGMPRTIGVWLILKDDKRSDLFRSLLDDKERIEQRIDCQGIWDWDGNRSGKVVQGRHTIRLEKAADAIRREEWDDQHRWLYAVLTQFLQEFGTRVPSLYVNSSG
jgi:hypothetical protein